MAWTIILENEEREQIESLDMELEYFPEVLFNSSNNEIFKLIKYLDPYGNTIFNHLQMGDLILDLKKLQDLRYDKSIDSLIQLALRCKSELHTYLVFYGD